MSTAAGERRHEPTGGRDWREIFELGFWNSDGSLGGFARFEIRPDDGVCWFWTSLLGADRRLVTVLEFGSPLPRWPSLELRGPSLWSELIVETPWNHVSLGLEAFAVELEAAGAVFEGCRGDLVPLGYDLEWESQPGLHPDGDAYELECTVHGEILVGEEAIAFDGVGARAHSWGFDPDALTPYSDTGLPIAPVELPGGERRAWVLDPTRPYWTDLGRSDVSRR